MNEIFGKLTALWNLNPNDAGNPGPGQDAVYVLFGDGQTILLQPPSAALPPVWGAQAATAQNLQARFSALRTVLTVDDFFLFYATDHGGNTAVLGGGLVPGARGPGPPTHSVPTPVDGSVVAAMENEPDNEPTLTVDYQGLTGPAPVFWNGTQIGSLDPAFTQLEFAVPEALVSDSNDVRFDNPNAAAFTVDQIEFFSGAIGDDPPASAACADGIDNDGDGLVDYGADWVARARPTTPRRGSPRPAGGRSSATMASTTTVTPGSSPRSRTRAWSWQARGQSLNRATCLSR